MVTGTVAVQDTVFVETVGVATGILPAGEGVQMLQTEEEASAIQTRIAAGVLAEEVTRFLTLLLENYTWVVVAVVVGQVSITGRTAVLGAMEAE